jgi:UDP-GlcNAc:undecaprenyl-phosphate/decaprenyl-phosphate GlcNAc-1-phosphate transferase
VSFPFNIYLAAIVSAFATVLVSLPVWRRWCVRTGLVDDPGERKIHHQPVPLAGGLAVMTGLLVPALAASVIVLWQSTARVGGLGRALALDSDAVFLLQYGLGRRAAELAAIFLGAFGMLGLGWLDDKRELKPQAKFAGQLLVAFLVAASGARITLFVHSQVFSYAVTVLWILTVVNAFNFMDNMNGLSSGLGALGAYHFAIIAAGDGQYLVALIAFLAFGALLGFLPYNFPRARAFLGDAGSHLVGYLLAVLAILPHFYTARHPRRWAVLAPLLILAIPLLDLVWVVLIRWRAGQPFYRGDTNHLSHRLVRRGFTQTQAVVAIWAAAEGLCLLSYLL